MNAEEPPNGELIVYQGQGLDEPIQVRLEGEMVWLSQKLMADLFQKDVRTINEHIQNIYEDEELLPESTIRKFRIVRMEGTRQVKRLIDHYNLEMIIAVGFRVRFRRGAQFRKWANERIREYLQKGFIMDDERLKNPGGWDYFDELLERIREIRASEKRFYQKVRDLFALSSDYADDPRTANLFFAEVKNSWCGRAATVNSLCLSPSPSLSHRERSAQMKESACLPTRQTAGITLYAQMEESACLCVSQRRQIGKDAGR